MQINYNIIKMGDRLLREKSMKVNLPLSDEDKKIMEELANYVYISSREELIKKYNLRPGVGIAAIQLGHQKRMFAINCLDFSKTPPVHYVLNVINPVIINKSKKKICLEFGEGCLSVDDITEVLTPRHEEITFKGYLYDMITKKVTPTKMTLTGYISVVFQHEFDHLNGILYLDNAKETIEELGDISYLKIGEDD